MTNDSAKCMYIGSPFLLHWVKSSMYSHVFVALLVVSRLIGYVGYALSGCFHNDLRNLLHVCDCTLLLLERKPFHSTSVKNHKKDVGQGSIQGGAGELLSK